MSRKNITEDDTPLMMSIMEDDPVKFRELLEKNPRRYLLNNAIFNLALKPEEFVTVENSPGPAGQTIIHVIAYHDAIQILCSILSSQIHRKDNYQIFEYKNTEEYLPIHMAFYGGAVNVASLMLNFRPDLAKKEIPSRNYQLLSLAALSESSILIDLLFELGLDPKSPVNSRDDQTHKPAIKIAIDSKNVDCIRSLIRGNARSNSQAYLSPIIYSLRAAYYDAVPLLIEAGENPEAVTPSKVGQASLQHHYDCPLSVACWQGEPAIECVRAIVSRIPSSLMPNTDHDLGGGPSHWMAQSKSLKIAQILANRSFDPNFRDSKGRTAVYNLMCRGKEMTVEIQIGILNILLEKGLDINTDYDPSTKFKPVIMEVLEQNDPNKEKIVEWFAQNGVSPYLILDAKRQTLREYVNQKKKLKKIFYSRYWK